METVNTKGIESLARESIHNVIDKLREKEDEYVKEFAKRETNEISISISIDKFSSPRMDVGFIYDL